MKNTTNIIGDKIIKILPYLKSFLFVDEISEIDEDHVIGYHTFSKNDFFYESHFIHKPVTPGIILIEMMGQIGMVCHLLFLNELYKNHIPFHPILSNVEASFLKEVNVDDKLKVISNKIYYRNGILKSNLQLFNSKDEICCQCIAQLQLVFD